MHLPWPRLGCSRRFRRWRAPRRGVQPIVATIMLVAITIVLIALVYLLIRPPKLSTPTLLDYVVQSGVSEQAWGDPTDCNSTSNTAHCDALPAIFVIFTGHIPQYLPVSQLTLILWCNGTRLLNGSFVKVALVPGTGQNPNASSPKLGTCGSWTPPKQGNQASFFNRLLFFQQLQPKFAYLEGGDQIVLYSHPPTNFADMSGHNPDDDFHGAPLWCWSVPTACSLEVIYTSSSQGTTALANIGLYGLGPS